MALFIALGGTGAYAADTLVGSGDISRNAVLSKHIKRANIKNSDLAAGAVNAAKVANGSLLGEDFAAGQIPQGLQGPQGDIGPPGDTGPPGSALGYGFVQANGDFDPAKSKNLIASKNTATNVYCLQFATPPANIVTTVSMTSAGFATATVVPSEVANSCTGPLPSANAAVLTIGAGAPFAGQPKAFYVVVN